MHENSVKSIWAAGGVVVSGWLTIPSSFSAEVMAHQGFDSIVIDLQHGAVDYQCAVTMMQAICTTPTIPLARVPWNDPGWLMKILDAGAYGVICPMINDRDEAEALVQASKYPPRGYRSCGPVRAKYACGTAYLDNANDNLLVIPQIETRAAIDNLDEILEVPGIDGVYVGPSDLAMALGSHARSGQDDEVVVSAKRHIVETCQRHGKPAGIHTPSADVALRMASEGYRFVTVASDDRFLAARAMAEVSSVRSGLERLSTASTRL